MTFIDFFAGIGGFRKGMELAGHKCVGFCEIDKYAVASYTAMHLCTEEQLEYLKTLPLKQRQKEILKEEYRNGEWFADDITRVYAGDIPKADCWCFGFPCTDVSISRKRDGLQGKDSSLFFRVMELCNRSEEEDKPAYLFIENVRNLLVINGGWDFARLLSELDGAGYDAQWSLFNSKNFRTPQNRERCFIVGRFRRRDTSKVLSLERTIREDNLHKVEQIGHINGRNRENLNQYRVYDPNGLSPCLTQMGGGGREPHIVDPKHTREDGIRKLTPKECFRLMGWPDEYFEKAQLVNSDTQLYKQAGNGVVVPVIEAIAKGFNG